MSAIVWALVPLKGHGHGKRRLATVVGEPLRRDLVLAMAEDIASALVRSRGLDRVMFVSEDPAVAELTEPTGIGWFRSTGRGLNEDLQEAAIEAESAGASHVLIVHADLPLVTAQDIDRFLGAGGGLPQPGQLRLAPCKQNSGTNVFLSPLPLPFSLCFGENSFAAFKAAAVQRAVMLQPVRWPSLALDIDNPYDLATLRALGVQGRLPPGVTADLIARLGEQTGLCSS